jgi:SUKH-3 immunity protein
VTKIFSPIIIKNLTEAGWYEERDIDITEYKDYFLQFNLGWSTSLENFLKEFGGLEVQTPEFDQIDSPVLSFDILLFLLDKPKYNVEGHMLKRIEWAKKYFQKNVYPIGCHYGWFCDLYIDEESNFYTYGGNPPILIAELTQA